MCDGQVRLLGDGADFGLCQRCEREQHVRKLRLREPVEHIALIFSGRHGRKDVPPRFGVAGNGGVMPRCNVRKPVFQRKVEHGAELDRLVAADAWIWRAAGRVRREKVADDGLLERLAQREHRVREVQRLAHAARVFGLGFAAVAKKERAAGHVIALLAQQISGGAAVYAAAHADENARLHALGDSVSSAASVSGAGAGCGGCGAGTASTSILSGSFAIGEGVVSYLSYGAASDAMFTPTL